MFPTAHGVVSQATSEIAPGNGPDGTRYYVPVTLPAADSALSNFPVFVDLGDMPAAFWAHAQANGGDIRITESDGVTRCPVELVSIDAVNETGELHFLASTVSNSAPTVYRLYYGHGSLTQPAAGVAFGRNAVWAEYEHVWHLSEASSAADATDSTGNDDLEAQGTPANQAGKVSGSRQVTGTSVGSATNWFKSTVTTPAPTPSELTFQAWFKMKELSDFAAQAASWNARTFYQKNSGDVEMTFTVMGSSATGIKTAVTTQDDAWVLLHGTHASGTTRLYRNGTQVATVGSQTIGDGIVGSPRAAIGGNRLGASGWRNGASVDEVRVRLTALTADWIAAEHANQTSPSTYYTVGSETPA